MTDPNTSKAEENEPPPIRHDRTVQDGNVSEKRADDQSHFSNSIKALLSDPNLPDELRRRLENR